ncbi:MAG TPA: Mur ligase family protein [Bacteriovoracaceae bacterium]|nr:Mur ligase family protein [Bacteriovoracaceae bacterium]
MLNDKSLGTILKSNLPPLKVDDVHWKTQDSTSSSLLFYRIGEDASAERSFIERIGKASYAWLIVNRKIQGLPLNSSVINEDLWPEIQKNCLDKIFPMPVLKLMALTGTNGKTTTTDLVLQLGELMGKKGLSIGTLGVRENHKTLLDFGLTSPSLIDLRKFLFKYGQDKDFCVLEASSHALVQGRLFGLEFDGAGWLSFSQDHLDYHHTMEDYFDAKCLLLNLLLPKAKIFIPAEQAALYECVAGKTTVCEKASTIDENLPVFFQTRFNRNNLEVAVALLSDIFRIAVPRTWDKIVPPDGRFFIRPYKSNYIVVDFAHTPDALENICKAIKEAFPEHRLKVLFGCGGDRDRNKRPKMGSVAECWADHVYLTSDNPRSEEPSQIIDDISKGIKNKSFERLVERPAAVQKAFSELKEKEVLLLAGKGHEDYILIKGVKHPYSDIREVEQFIARKSS